MTGLLGYGLDMGMYAAGQAARQAADQRRLSQPTPGEFFDNVARQQQGAGSGGTLGTVGQVAMFTGAAINAVGSFFDASAKQEQLKAAADFADYQARMADRNARMAELDAQSILRAGRQQIGLLTLRAGHEKSRRRVSAAARGVDLGVGSTAELMASEDIAREIDKSVVRTNTVRAANATRMQAVNSRNQGTFARLGASNLRRSADSISPALAGLTSAAGSTGRIAQFYASR